MSTDANNQQYNGEVGPAARRHGIGRHHAPTSASSRPSRTRYTPAWGCWGGGGRPVPPAPDLVMRSHGLGRAWKGHWEVTDGSATLDAGRAAGKLPLYRGALSRSRDRLCGSFELDSRHISGAAARTLPQEPGRSRPVRPLPGVGPRPEAREEANGEGNGGSLCGCC